MKIAKYASFILMFLCITAFIILTICFAPQAESVGVLLIFMVLWFPALPVIAVTELIQLLSDRTNARKEQHHIELIGLLIAVGTSLFMSGFWLLMILQGGNKIMPMAYTVIGVNLTACMLLWIKMKISSFIKPKE